MKKRIAVALVLAVLFRASAYAQTTDFFKLVNRGTPEAVQTAIKAGADVNARNNDGLTPLMLTAYNTQTPW